MNPTVIYDEVYFSAVPEITALTNQQVLSFKNSAGDSYINVMDQGNVGKVPTSFVENGITVGIGNSTARTNTKYSVVQGPNAVCNIIINGDYFIFYKVSQSTPI